MRKAILAILLILLTPLLAKAQAGAPGVMGPWSILNMASDVHSSDLGCYNQSQVAVAKRNLRITMIGGSFSCGQTNSQSGTFTTTQAYKSGSLILTGKPIQPTAGNPVTVVVRGQMGRGWHAFWLLGTNCNPASLGTWDNVGACSWDNDAASSAEIDLAEATLHGYTEMGHSVHSSGSDSCTVNLPGGADATAGVHTYSMIWSTSSIQMFVDGVNANCSYTRNPTHPMYLILEDRQQNGAVDAGFATQPVTTVQYVQICQSAVSGCTNPDTPVGTGNTTFYDDFSSYAPPVVFFTDLTSGPSTGGENNNGTILTLYGRNFGATQGSSAVTVGGGAVAAVKQWGTKSKAGSAPAQLETISVAIGASAATGTVQVATPLGNSLCADTKDTCQFTVRSGNIHCVSTTGVDSGGGTFPSSCWRTIVFAKNSLIAGDIAYIQNGVNQTTVDNFNADLSIVGNNCTVTSPCALVVYPGATSTIGTNSAQFAIRTPAVGGVKDFWTIAGFNLVGLDALDLVAVTGWRVINNDMTCPGGSGQSACMHTDTTTQYRFYGNYTHDVGTTAGSIDKFYHGNYYTTNSNHIWSAWNEVNNNPSGITTSGGCRAVQFFSTGGSDQFDLHVHDNYLHNSICDGLNFSTVNPDNGTVEAYNNVIFHVGTGPDPANGASDYACIVAGGGGTSAVQFFNNTMYDCGGRKAADSGVIFVGRTASMWNNISQQLSGEVYLTSSSAAGSLNGSNNDWFGGGTAPSQTTGNLTVDPLFVTAGSNFQLQSTSTMLGAGTAAHTQTFDFNALVRPSPPAIGAYEFSQGSFSPTPGVSFSPTSASFNSTVVGNTAPTIPVTLTNTGTATLIVGSMTITGTNPGDFAFVTSPAANCGTNILAGGTCTITLSFTPTLVGARSATFSMTDNATGSPHTIPLSGTGQPAPAPIVTLNPTSLTFITNRFTTSASQSVTLTNTGTANLTLTQITTSGLFNESDNCPIGPAIIPGGSCTLNVTFSPNATGPFSGTVSISDNAAGSPHVITLTGTGTAPVISLTPGSYAFGNVTVNTSANSTPFTLQNTGNGPLAVLLTLGGTNPSFFGIVSTNCPGTLNAGLSCTITVSFNPTTAISYSATLVETDSVQGINGTSTLTGTGIPGGTTPIAPFVPILIGKVFAYGTLIFKGR